MADNPLLPQPQPRALKPAVLAIDGGNSKTDVALVASDGTLLAAFPHTIDPTDPRIITAIASQLPAA